MNAPRIGATLVATSVAVTASVLSELGLIGTSVAYAVVGAAVVGGTSFAGAVTLSAPTVSISPRTAAFGTPAVLPANTSETQRYYRVIVGYTVV